MITVKSAAVVREAETAAALIGRSICGGSRGSRADAAGSSSSWGESSRECS